MNKGIIFVVIALMVAAILVISIEFTGKIVEGGCAGIHDFYLCVNGDGDFVINGTAVPLALINTTIGNSSCKLISLSSNQTFVFRYTNDAIKGEVYDSDQDLIGENINEHDTANYKCYLEDSCNLTCSEYLVWE